MGPSIAKCPPYVGVSVLAGLVVLGSTTVPARAAEPEPSFGTPVSYPGGDAYALATADLNGDGNLDIVSAQTEDAEVGVMLGDGDGAFGALSVYPTGDNPGSVALGDLNGDGNPDAVTGNRVDGSVAVLLGDGDGAFAEPVEYTVGQGLKSAGSVALADLDNDDELDVISTGSREVGDEDQFSIAVLLGDGDGTLQDPVDYDIGASAKPDSIAAGDLDDDGNQDVVFASNANVGVMLGDGDGTLGAESTFPITGDAFQVSLGQFDDNNNLDVVAVGDDVELLLGAGDGTFGSPTNVFSEATTWLAIGDLTDSGDTDIAIPLTGGDGVAVLPGNGNATFGTATEFATGQAENVATLADFNNDGLQDIAVSNITAQTVNILLNTAAPVITSIEPDSGTTFGGNEITIDGKGFTSAMSVSIGGNPATDVVVVDRTQLTTVTPSGVKGGQDVVVTRSDDKTGTLPDGFTYRKPPANLLIKDSFKAGKKLKPDKQKRLVKAKLKAPEISTSVQTEPLIARNRCYLHGERLRGADKDLNCTFKTTATAEKITVKGTPLCSVGLRMQTKIVAKYPGAKKTRWEQTWGVENSPRTHCSLSGNG